MSGPFLITTTSTHTAMCKDCRAHYTDTSVRAVTDWMESHRCAGGR